MIRSWPLLVALLLLCAPAARAIDELEAEENISELMPSKLPGEEKPHALERRPWAVLPEFGYGPDTGPMAGVKFAHRDLFQSGAALDVEATYALNEQQMLNFSLGSPHIDHDRFLVLLRLYYLFDPQRDFFGLGNNDLLDCGEDPGPECHCEPGDPLYPDCPQGGALSTHEFQDIAGALTVGWRPFERIAFNLSIGLRQVDVRPGERKDRIAFTPDKYPDLPGVDGGVVQPVAVSLVWNTRDDVMRPTRGWRVILKIISANHAYSDFRYNRFLADAGYLRSFAQQRYILGIRLGGEWIDSGNSPFWELAELGGQDTLRGFFPHRFVGRSRIVANGEFRARLTEFDFYDLWHVKIDGVLFGDGGRVFVNRSDLKDEFHVDSDIIGRILDDFQYSYGTGVRIVLSDALVARIDAGFSDEETGLIYLSFGHTF